MIGWNLTDWLTLQAGRIKNPLYTKPMVWDKDLTWDGASWKTKYKMSKQTTISTTGGVNTMQGDDKQSTEGTDTDSQYQLSAQVIGKHKFDVKSGPSFKTGLTYTMYTNDDNLNTESEVVFNPSVIGNDATGINDLSLIEIPADYKMMVKPGLGMTVFLIPEQKVVYIADLVTPNRVLMAVVPDFNIKEWERSIEEILEMDFEKAVYSHNESADALNGGDKQDARDNLQFIKDIRAGIYAGFKEGGNPMEIPSKLKLPKYKDWAMYDEWLAMNVWRVLLDEFMGPFPWRPIDK